ncbi:EF1G factor, partial [Sterrhoptilus dennistouni]|nr:EF1G factor [Sterrhoptilus dennistouni]
LSPQTLYTYPENWRAFKALIAAQYSGARLRVASAPPQFSFGHTNRSPQFLKKFPLGKVPAFEGDDGFCVFESNAIAYYGTPDWGLNWALIGTEELRGSTPEAAAAVLQWVNFADSDVVPPASTWVFPTLGILHYNKQATEVAKEEVRRVLGVLDGHLRTRTFLVGERVSLADISLVCALLWLYKQVLDPAFRGPFGNVNRWFLTCLNQPQFKAVLGEVQLCQRMAQFDGVWGHPEGSVPALTVPCVPSPFVLDEFKRKYSNEDTLTVALPHFWEHFDREGWSLWYCQYRYPEELSQTFMSCNLITGMFQRLDKLRKNAFASVILFGGDNNSSISGVWVMRGHELAFTLCPDWQVDYESYSWRRLDPDSAECRTLVTEYFLWEGDFSHVGKPFNQGKIFK